MSAHLQSQPSTSGPVERRQGQAPGHLCPSQLQGGSGWLWRAPWQGVQSWTEAGIGAGCQAPSFLGSSLSHQTGNSLGEEAMPPPSGQGFSEHRGLFFSASLRCEERQTVSPHRSGLCSAPPCRGSREGFQQTAFAQVFFPKNSLRKHNISSSFPHCYPDFLAGQMKTPSSVSCSDWPMSSGYSTIRIETTG